MIDYDISLRYMLAGYGVVFLVLAVYIGRLILKWTKLRKEYWLLKKEKKP